MCRADVGVALLRGGCYEYDGAGEPEDPFGGREYTGGFGLVQEHCQAGARVDFGGLEELVGNDVVLDTAGSIVYLGRLIALSEQGFWLEQADLHNVEEGHATREQYIAESSRDGIRVNRGRVFVLRHTVVSVSALSDVVAD